MILSQAVHELWDQEEKTSTANQKILELSTLNLISEIQSTQHQLPTPNFREARSSGFGIKEAESLVKSTNQMRC